MKIFLFATENRLKKLKGWRIKFHNFSLLQLGSDSDTDLGLCKVFVLILEVSETDQGKLL